MGNTYIVKKVFDGQPMQKGEVGHALLSGHPFKAIGLAKGFKQQQGYEVKQEGNKTILYNHGKER